MIPGRDALHLQRATLAPMSAPPRPRTNSPHPHKFAQVCTSLHMFGTSMGGLPEGGRRKCVIGLRARGEELHGDRGGRSTALT